MAEMLAERWRWGGWRSEEARASEDGSGRRQRGCLSLGRSAFGAEADSPLFVVVTESGAAVATRTASL